MYIKQVLAALTIHCYDMKRDNIVSVATIAIIAIVASPIRRLVRNIFRKSRAVSCSAPPRPSSSRSLVPDDSKIVSPVPEAISSTELEISNTGASSTPTDVAVARVPMLFHAEPDFSETVFVEDRIQDGANDHEDDSARQQDEERGQEAQENGGGSGRGRGRGRGGANGNDFDRGRGRGAGRGKGSGRGRSRGRGRGRGRDRGRGRGRRGVWARCLRCGVEGHNERFCSRSFCPVRRRWPYEIMLLARDMRREAGVPVVYSN